MGDPVWDRRLLCSSRGKKEQAAGGEDGGQNTRRGKGKMDGGEVESSVASPNETVRNPRMAAHASFVYPVVAMETTARDMMT